MANKNLTLAVDVDEVVLDMLAEWVRRYNLQYGQKLKLEDVDQWDMTKVCPAAGTKIYDILRQPGFYADVDPLPGALEAVKAARFFGIRIIFVSSCVIGTLDEKVQRLVELGFLPEGKTQKDFIAATDKSMVRANFLIDDNVDNVESWERENGRCSAFLVNQPHNAKLTTHVRRADNVGEAIRRAWVQHEKEQF